MKEKEEDGEVILGEEEIEEEIEEELSKEELRNNNDIESLKDEIKQLKKKMAKQDQLEFENEVMFGPSTKIQFSGTSHMTTIPKEIVRKFNLRKGDRMKWRIAKYQGMKIITIAIDSDDERELRPPLKEDTE